VEIRSVNNRYFKSAVRLPEWLAFLEPEVDRRLREKIGRGTVNYSLKSRSSAEGSAGRVNTAVLTAYLRQLRSVPAAELPAGAAPTIDLATLLTLPGVCETHDGAEEEREPWRAAVEKLTSAALDRLLTMRTVEGKALWADLEKQCRAIAVHLDAVAVRAPSVPAEYRNRLQDRVNALLANSGVTVAGQDLLREVAVFAERCDISEEISRLTGHIEQFLTTGRTEEAAGRKLEFLGQEMLREANTIGSKANDAEIVRHIVEIKGAADRIKEQVQNVE
jgi:uncharacterized protein (TIGR00255 family)